MPKKILLADDSVTIQKVVELTFAEGDYEVTCVSNGRAAIERLKANRPDILLCDIIMPELSGYDVAEFVKKDPVFKGIPVILLTGTFEPFDEEKARQSGADAATIRSHYESSIPMGRFARPEEMAYVAVALCSGLCSYVNGSNIVVDGGELSR